MSHDVTLERTQVQFERWQHDALKARAAREGRSLSGIVREAVTAFLAAPTGSPTIDSITGVVSDVTLRGADHDALLYRAGSEVQFATASKRSTPPGGNPLRKRAKPATGRSKRR